MKKEYPQLILLIGPSACGKSLFSRYFRGCFPQYEKEDDRSLVEKYLKETGLLAIEDPCVWDNIIIQLAKNLKQDKKYIVEFARGHDSNYLSKFNLEPKDVYPRTIDLILSSMHPGFTESVGIIHIDCRYEARTVRNSERRKSTGQDLPDSVLNKVFKDDVFMPEYIDEKGPALRRGKFIKSIPVVTIDNSQTIEDGGLSEHFTSLATKTMNLLISGF